MTNEPIGVGSVAPDFALKNQTDTVVRLSDFRGRQVILSFHPLAWTSVCTIQMQDLEKNKTRIEALGAVALGISVDSRPCKKAWAEAIGIKETALLADFWPHGEVAQQYGLFFQEFGFSMRSVVIVGKDGMVRWKKVWPTKQVPDIEEILQALEGGA